MAEFLQGRYTLKNPSKYKGDASQVFYRSSWERIFMTFCDSNPNVLAWSSEEIVIPYVCPTDNKTHRYFPDFWVRIRNKQNQIEERLIEIKPRAQTIQPKQPKRKTKRYINEVMSFAKNQAKWKNAYQFCQKKGWKFQILTENDLGIKK